MGVSIPNGKPGPLRQGRRARLCARGSWFQSQTGSQALSDLISPFAMALHNTVSIPNGKPGPLRHYQSCYQSTRLWDVSIPNGKPGPLRQADPECEHGTSLAFQSQTGSQ